MAKDEVVLVTGASGFVALHIVKLLLNEGYRVRGTVRSLLNEKKLKPIKDVCPENKEKLLELVEADLTKDEGWAEAVSGCDYVMHVASPFPNAAPENEEDLINPAMEGTKRILSACADEVARNGKKLKRVILTSSIVAVHGESSSKPEPYTEDDWSDITSKALDAYGKSKTLAEKAAWNYVESLPENRRFQLSVINPGLVFGPILSNEAATSVGVIYRMMDVLTMPLIPRVNLCVCDVRDVALAHLRALKIPEAAGKRHLIVSGHYWMGEIAQTLYDEFSKYGYRVPLWISPYFAMWFWSFFDKSSRLLLPRVGHVYKFDNKRMQNVLGIEPRKPEETFIDTVHSLIQNGVMKPTKSYTSSVSSL